MELVYLWVEDYKNIKKQGFNFSPRFDCEFKAEYEKNKNREEKLKDNCELIIKKNKNYESIFPKNINVTAIVGENGSGKSSVLECLLSILINNEKIYKYLIIVKNNNGDLIQYDSLDININDVNKKIAKIEKNYNGRIVENYKNIASLFITNEYIEESFFEKIKYISEQSNTIRTYAEKKNINTKILENAKKFANVQFIKDAKNFFLPTKVRIKIEDFKDLTNLKVKEQKTIEQLKEKADGFLKENKYKEYLKKIFEIFEIFKNSKSYPSSTIAKTIDEDYIYGYNEDLSESYASLLDKLGGKAFENNIFYEFIVSDIDEEILKFLKSINNIHILKIELLDDNKSFESLSYGERQLLNQLHLILNHFDWKKINTFDHSTWNEQTDEPKEASEDIKIKKYFLFIDELELGLHPNWQKKTLSYMIDFFKMFDIKIDLFITSHSPFILSDLPKENVLFLEKDEKTGNCINVTSEINIEIFGANIHTLLSHGFFMKDGLMGEFVKGKITAIKDFYEKVKKSKNQKNEHKQEFENNIENFKHVQSIIGEPFLKTIMKNYLDELELIFSDDEDLINKELKELEKRKLYLEKLKNAKN